MVGVGEVGGQLTFPGANPLTTGFAPEALKSQAQLERVTGDFTHIPVGEGHLLSRTLPGGG